MTDSSFPAPRDEAYQAPVETLDVVGLTFAEGYPGTILQMQKKYNGMSTEGQNMGYAGKLVRNPANEYDSNAIEVHVAGVGLVGHLAAKDGTAARLAPQLDAGAIFLVAVFPRVDPAHPTHPGLTVRLTRTTA